MLGSTVTLVVVTRDRVVRAEFRARGKPASVVVRERPDTDDPVAAIVAGLGTDRRRPGSVFVLSSDVWTRTVEVPAMNLRSMSAAELQQSLAFEIEPLSGLSPSEAATAAVPLAASAKAGEVWIGQLSAAALAEMDEVVRGVGGKLAGVLHPAAVPASLGGAGSSCRIEFWADATARVVATGSQMSTLQVEQAAATANRQAIIDEWVRQSPGDASVEVLLPDFRPSLEGESTFADEATLETWLSAWHAALTARKPVVPIIRPAPRPLSKEQRRNVAVVLGALALAACVGHGYWVRSGIEAAQAEQTRLEAPGKELASIKQQQADTEKKLTTARDALTKRTAEVKQAETTLAAHRRRLGDLLDRLGRESSHQWVLRSIEGNPRDMKLTGMTMHPEHISALAAELAHELSQVGWSVDPPQHTARNLLDDGGPWLFELRIRDEAALKLPASSAPAVTPAGPPNLVRIPSE